MGADSISNTTIPNVKKIIYRDIERNGTKILEKYISKQDHKPDWTNVFYSLCEKNGEIFVLIHLLNRFKNGDTWDVAWRTYSHHEQPYYHDVPESWFSRLTEEPCGNVWVEQAKRIRKALDGLETGKTYKTTSGASFVFVSWLDRESHSMRILMNSKYFRMNSDMLDLNSCS